MVEEKNNTNRNGKNNLEDEKTTNIQKHIEEKITEDEQNLEGEQLSGELSKDRTHMSEHRTRMSEHRTGLSRNRLLLYLEP
jgi:putative membrane protein